MLVKASPTSVQTAAETGEFTALVSVFDTVDSYGDVVQRGAFANTLAAWKASGDPIPVVFNHAWADPFSHVGSVVEAEEKAEGLWVRGVIDLTDNPTAAQVHRLLKSRRLKSMSFAYDVVRGARAERDGRDVYELHELSLLEVGPCLVGVNREAELLTAKAAQMTAGFKAGRTPRPEEIAALNEAADAIAACLSEAKSTDAPPTPHAPSPALVNAWADTLTLEGLTS